MKFPEFENRRAVGVAAACGLVLALALASCGRPTAGSAGSGGGQAQVAAAGSATTSASGGLADGTYDCGDGEHTMGKVDIQGATFRYRPLDAPGGDFAPYSVTGGQISWGGPFPSIDDAPPAKITESTVENWGFNVKFQVTPGSYIDTMSCHAPGK